jgi:hypothetical protein
MTFNSMTQVELNSSGISCERLDGEMVIISFETGKYFNSNGAAADILYLIENSVDRSLWGQILGKEFSDFEESSSGIAEFLGLLLEEKIVLESSEVAVKTIDLPTDYQRGAWQKPALLVFDDLADLLLIDPIHDTSLEGWPTVKND